MGGSFKCHFFGTMYFLDGPCPSTIQKHDRSACTAPLPLSSLVCRPQSCAQPVTQQLNNLTKLTKLGLGDSQIAVAPGLPSSLRMLQQGKSWASLRNDTMQIQVNDVNGATVGTFTLQCSDTVHALKEKIRSAAKIPSARQQLWSGASYKPLEEARTLRVYTKKTRDENTGCDAEYAPHTITVLVTQA